MNGSERYSGIFQQLAALPVCQQSGSSWGGLYLSALAPGADWAIIHLGFPTVGSAAAAKECLWHTAFITSQNGLGWKGPQSPPTPPPAVGRAAPHQLRLPKAPSNLALNVSRDGAPTSLRAAVPAPHHLLSKEFLPNFKPKFKNNSFCKLQPYTFLLTWLFCDPADLPNAVCQEQAGHA